MKNVAAEIVGKAIDAFLGRAVALALIHCCTGCILFITWDMVIRGAWPTLPFIPWYHLAMVSLTWATIKDGVIGGLPK